MVGLFVVFSDTFNKISVISWLEDLDFAHLSGNSYNHAIVDLLKTQKNSILKIILRNLGLEK
jgi:hypothetical protein